MILQATQQIHFFADIFLYVLYCIVHVNGLHQIVKKNVNFNIWLHLMCMTREKYYVPQVWPNWGSNP